MSSETGRAAVATAAKAYATALGHEHQWTPFDPDQPLGLVACLCGPNIRVYATAPCGGRIDRIQYVIDETYTVEDRL